MVTTETLELGREDRCLLVRHFLTPNEASLAFHGLLREVVWMERTIVLFGREVLEPRRVAWYGAPEAAYTYSGRPNVPLPWTPHLSDLHRRVEAFVGETFNGVLLNHYRSGQDSMGFHADDEPELGPRPIIASLSLGATRRFVFAPKRKAAHERRFEVELDDGSLLVMGPGVQAHWKHGVPKTTRPVGPRINLTFRRILSRGTP